jgi:cytochrome c oxidase subunit 3
MAPAAHGEHHPRFVHHFESLANQKEAATLGMWCFLVTEVLFFGGLFTTYTVYRNLFYPAFAAGSHHLDIKLGAINTAVLICSSLTMAMAVHSAAIGKRAQIVMYLLATLLLGSIFLGVKVVEYVDKFENHLVPGAHFSAEHLHNADGSHLSEADGKHAQLYFSLYFAMTGLHASHMIIGMPMMLWLALMAARGKYTPAWYTPVEMFGLYWHFVDIVWIFLFPLLYLIPGHHG